MKYSKYILLSLGIFTLLAMIIIITVSDNFSGQSREQSLKTLLRPYIGQEIKLSRRPVKFYSNYGPRAYRLAEIQTDHIVITVTMYELGTPNEATAKLFISYQAILFIMMMPDQTMLIGLDYDSTIE